MIRLPKGGGLPHGLALTHPAALLATWFGVGLLPWAPGTWGSLAALPLVWLAHVYLGIWGVAGGALVLFVIGWWAAAVYVGRSSNPDPGPVVIDEVAGQFLALTPVALAEPDIGLYILGFLLFRAADIGKPWPASWADQRVKGGFGVMLDDGFAALYVALLLYGLIYWMGGA